MQFIPLICRSLRLEYYDCSSDEQLLLTAAHSPTKRDEQPLHFVRGEASLKFCDGYLLDSYSSCSFRNGIFDNRIRLQAV
jgi:hypothetical protein